MDKRGSRIWSVVCWLAGVAGATLVFLATVPPDQVRDNLQAWALTVGFVPDLSREAAGLPQPRYETRFMVIGIASMVFVTLYTLAHEFRRWMERDRDSTDA